jgi:hypothetical protein
MTEQAAETAPVVETAPTEGTEAPVTAPEPKPGDNAQRFAFLARKEAALQKSRAEIKAQLQKLESEKSEMAKMRAEIDSLKSQKKDYRQNPLSLLEENGLTYKELTDFILNNNTVSTESQIKQIQTKLEAVEKQREIDRQEAQKRAEEEQSQREVQVINEFKGEIHNFVTANKDKFELTHLYEAQNLVYDTVEEYFSKTQKILSIPEACDLVEKYLESLAEKSLKTKKLSGKIGQPLQTEPKPKEPATAPRRTLTNSNYTASTPSLVTPKIESDRMARALAALDN